MSHVNRAWPAEWITCDDPLTGRRVTQLTAVGNNAKAYFTAPHFVDDGNTLVFCSDRSGTWEVYKLDMTTGSIVQLTDDANMTARNSRISLCCHPTKPLAYVMAGNNDRILAIDIARGGSDVLAHIPGGFTGDLIAINADGSRIASTYIQDLFSQPNQLITRREGEIYGGAIEAKYRRPTSIVFTIDTATGHAEAAWGDHAYLDHVQLIQGDDDRLVFCHGSPNVAQRMWLVDIADYPGKQPTPLVAQEPQREAVVHEFACADGWIGYQYRVFHGGYRKNPVEYFSFVDPQTGQTQDYRLPGPRPGHFQATRDRLHMIADAWSVEGETEEDWPAKRYGVMCRYDVEGDHVIATPLARHDSSWLSHEAHPHPVFTPDERHVIWASDRGGATHLYMCDFDV